VAAVLDELIDLGEGLLLVGLEVDAVAQQVVRSDREVDHVYYWIEGDPSINVASLLIDLKPFGATSPTARCRAT
jgi:hypothetical protein